MNFEKPVTKISNVGRARANTQLRARVGAATKKVDKKVCLLQNSLKNY